jgi:hypothetical protein
MEHTELLNSLNTQCNSIGLTLYEHNYNYMHFGSWSLVVGTSKNRMQFSWDGKESYLGISVSSFQNSNSAPCWESDLSGISGTTLSEEQVFQFIYEKLCAQYNS